MKSSIIVNAFNSMGGDPLKAFSAGYDFTTVNRWIAWQATQSGIVGAGALAVPAAHLAALVADVAILLHKMAYCAWGVAGVLNVGIKGKDDFAIILGIWAGAISEDEIPELIGYTSATAGAVVTMATVAPAFTEKVIVKGAGKAAEVGTAALSKKVGLKSAAKGIGKLTGKVGEKIAAKVAAKITAKLSVKSVAGFIPIIGPTVGGGINAYFVSHIGKAAEKYYLKKKEIISNS